MRIVSRIILGCIIAGSCIPCFAQKKSEKKKAKAAQEISDTVSFFRQFIMASNRYKQLPLQLEMQIDRYTEVPGIPVDTSSLRAVFYLSDNESYSKIGDQEQLSSDSFLLQVSHEAQRMFLHRKSLMITEMLNNATGFQLRDSSLRFLMNNYQISVRTGGDNIDTFALISKGKAFGNQVPLEDIILLYDKVMERPVSVTLRSRNLIPASPDEYSNLPKDSLTPLSFVKVNEREAYLIQTQTSIYRFTNFSHNNLNKMPVRIYDRISRNTEGEWEAVKEYENYRLVQRF
ncbi:MAG: hypothetical protein GXC78_07235 [Chitinophagaceae bacterium]|jgi:hypothetical protein|nr:hypothetical protein [Chitinophagaceae bacterium]